MVFQKITVTRLFKTAGNCFGVKTNGKRYFDAIAQGRPNVHKGMKVIALLRAPDAFDDAGPMGWMDYEDGSIACNGVFKHLGWSITAIYFGFMFVRQGDAVIANLVNADLIALAVSASFLYFSVQHLQAADAPFMIRLALTKVRNLVMTQGGIRGG